MTGMRCCDGDGRWFETMQALAVHRLELTSLVCSPSGPSESRSLLGGTGFRDVVGGLLGKIRFPPELTPKILNP